MTLLGRTALSVEIITNVSVPHSTAARAMLRSSLTGMNAPLKPPTWELANAPPFFTASLIIASATVAAIGNGAAFAKGRDFAAWLGVENLITHVGFIPEFPGDPLYQGTLVALKTVARTCQAHGVQFWFETGQETPITLRRAIEGRREM